MSELKKPGRERYTNLTPTPVTLGGITIGSTFDHKTQTEMWDDLLYPYIAPSVILTYAGHPTSTLLREFGDILTSVDLIATTTKHSNDITSVVFKRGAATIFTVPAPIAGGGVETYTELPDVTTSTSFTAVVGDGTATTISNAVSFTFVYPFYYGVGAQGLTGAQIAALTKLIKTQSNTTTTTSPTNQVFYFAYPDAYAGLTSILDTNGFETISDYSLSVKVITGLDGNPVNYKCYEYDNLTTQVAFNNTYKF